MDIMNDELADSRSLRLYNVPDDFNREGMLIEADLSLPTERIVRARDQLIEGGAPRPPFAATMDLSTSA